MDSGELFGGLGVPSNLWETQLRLAITAGGEALEKPLESDFYDVADPARALLRLEFVERPPHEKSQEEPDPGGAIPRELLPAAPDGG